METILPGVSGRRGPGALPHRGGGGLAPRIHSGCLRSESLRSLVGASGSARLATRAPRSFICAMTPARVAGSLTLTGGSAAGGAPLAPPMPVRRSLRKRGDDAAIASVMPSRMKGLSIAVLLVIPKRSGLFLCSAFEQRAYRVGDGRVAVLLHVLELAVNLAQVSGELLQRQRLRLGRFRLLFTSRRQFEQALERVH